MTKAEWEKERDDGFNNFEQPEFLTDDEKLDKVLIMNRECGFEAGADWCLSSSVVKNVEEALKRIYEQDRLGRGVDSFMIQALEDLASCRSEEK